MSTRRLKLAWKYRRLLWKYRGAIRKRREIAAVAGTMGALLLANWAYHHSARRGVGRPLPQTGKHSK